MIEKIVKNEHTAGIIRKVCKYVGRTLLCLITCILVIATGLLSAIYIVSTGPSDVVRELYVNTMVETGALDFCAYMFLDEDVVNEIVAKSQIVAPEDKTDVNLIVIGEDSDKKDEEQKERERKKDQDLGIEYDEDGVCLLDITGKTYVGKILIVKDPTRVDIVGLEKYGTGIVGKTTVTMAKEHDALAAINAGGYAEQSDYKTGGIPMGRDGDGVVILDGELKWGHLDWTYEIIGFDENHILRIDKMTAQEALNEGIVEAINWGPVLVKNGEPCVVNTTSQNPGFHPRSAIGQRADGSIILLVIDGRQAHSMGASYDDLVEIMVKYGAVNASNLDGGMSSYLYYKDEVITSPYMLYFNNGKRTISTSIIVSKKSEN